MKPDDFEDSVFKKDWTQQKFCRVTEYRPRGIIKKIAVNRCPDCGVNLKIFPCLDCKINGH